MGGRRGYGPTHSQSIEAMFAGIPGLNIVAPSHLLDPGELLSRCSTLTKDPVLFIENKLLYSQRLVTVQDGRAGQFFCRGTHSCFPTLHLSLSDRDRPDVAIVTYGGNVAIALEAAQKLLIDHEYLCDLVIPSLLAPLPVADIAGFLNNVRNVAVLEEGPRRAGWGSEVIASLSERGTVPARRYLRLAAPDSPIPSSKQLEKELLPDADSVVQTLYRWLSNKS